MLDDSANDIESRNLHSFPYLTASNRSLTVITFVGNPWTAKVTGGTTDFQFPCVFVGASLIFRKLLAAVRGSPVAPNKTNAARVAKNFKQAQYPLYVPLSMPSAVLG